MQTFIKLSVIKQTLFVHQIKTLPTTTPCKVDTGLKNSRKKKSAHIFYP